MPSASYSLLQVGVSPRYCLYFIKFPIECATILGFKQIFVINKCFCAEWRINVVSYRMSPVVRIMNSIYKLHNVLHINAII